LGAGSKQNKWVNLNIRCVASRHFRENTMEYLKDNINEHRISVFSGLCLSSGIQNTRKHISETGSLSFLR
jgi:hypothetical protein